MRVILVPVADRTECRVALAAAFGLAANLDANVAGYHVRPHRREETKRSKAAGDGLLAGDRSDWHKNASKDSLDSRSARNLFARMAKEHDVPVVKRPQRDATRCALWTEMVGTPARIFSVIGPVADLTVFSRPKIRARGAGKSFVMAGLLHSAKPVLVLPQKGTRTPGKRVLIAWNQSPEAAAAVTAAIPILRKADEVTLVRSGAENRPGPKTAHVASYLAHWGVRARRVSTRGADSGGEIQQVFSDRKADLMLMGAYTRGHFREIVFGGFTETVLTRMDVPALMYHR